MRWKGQKIIIHHLNYPIYKDCTKILNTEKNNRKKTRMNTFHLNSLLLYVLLYQHYPKENIIFLMACKTENIMSKNTTATTGPQK